MEDVILQVNHLSKSFGSHEVLRDIDFTVAKGDVTSIIGASGSGKSTLLRCINLLETPTSGEVCYHGKNVAGRGVNAPAYRAHVGMVFQSFNLFNNMTVLENCMVGQVKVLKRSREEARAHAMTYLEKVGMAPYINAKPRQISGGQKQRVAIARALATDPKVLLCDEATSALDPTTTNSILALLKELNQKLGVTVVIITHQMSVVEEVCNRVAILDNGTVVEEGEVQAIFSHPSSAAAKRLVYPAGAPKAENLPGHKLVRVAFGGTQTTDKPLVASLAIECGALVSIMGADTRIVNGQTLGSMLLALPEDEHAEAALEYIKNYPGITYEEVNN